MEKVVKDWRERAVCPRYNPRTDIKKVSPNGALDLKEAFANNVIPADLAIQEAKFNNIDDPASIVGRVKDTIDAEVMSRELSRMKVPEKPKTDE